MRDVSNLRNIQHFEAGIADGLADHQPRIRPDRGAEFLEGLSKVVGDRTLTVFEGGTPPALALAAAENAAAKMTVKVLRADSEFEILAENEMGEGLVASPAISGGQIFLRGEKHLFCIGK